MTAVMPLAAKKVLCLSAALALAIIVLAMPVSFAASGAISQSYKTSSDNVTKGALVSFVSDGTTEVEPATISNGVHLAGIAADKPLVELSSGDAEANTRVVVNGSTEALVSDINGSVKAGDKITASPISGIGMKAGGAAEIIGTAQNDLDSVTTINRTVKTKDGEDQTIKVGLLLVAVNVAYYSASSSEGAIASFVPPFLQSVANTIAGRPVSALRVLLGTLVLLAGFVTAMIILYTSIRNGVISIGRNPLAQGALRKGMRDVILAVIGLLGMTAFLVYVSLVI